MRSTQALTNGLAAKTNSRHARRHSSTQYRVVYAWQMQHNRGRTYAGHGWASNSASAATYATHQHTPCGTPQHVAKPLHMHRNLHPQRERKAHTTSKLFSGLVQNPKQAGSTPPISASASSPALRTTHGTANGLQGPSEPRKVCCCAIIPGQSPYRRSLSSTKPAMI